VATELTNANGSDHLSDAAVGKSCDEVSGMEKVLEPSKTQVVRSEEKLTTNPIPETSTPTEARCKDQ